MSLFEPTDDLARASALRHVKALAKELLGADPHDVVVVDELACGQPDCPPIETVILLIRNGYPPRQVKVPKRAVDVTADDIRDAATAAPDGPPR